MTRLALYQPDIPQNLGTMLRLCACMGTDVDIILPCGFPLDDRKLQRAGMDYIEHVNITKHNSWQDFTTWKATQSSRLILLTTRATTEYTDFAFRPDDIIMVGRESSGVPQEVADYADAGIIIPMKPPMRSLNVAVSAAMALGEALRQTKKG